LRREEKKRRIYRGKANTENTNSGHGQQPVPKRIKEKAARTTPIFGVTKKCQSLIKRASRQPGEEAAVVDEFRSSAR
jgi:hypothetical protein